MTQEEQIKKIKLSFYNELIKHKPMTAVEQLIHDLKTIELSVFNENHCKKYLDLEKQQIINAYDNGYDTAGLNAEQYYNETFKK